MVSFVVSYSSPLKSIIINRDYNIKKKNSQQERQINFRFSLYVNLFLTSLIFYVIIFYWENRGDKYMKDLDKFKYEYYHNPIRTYSIEEFEKSHRKEFNEDTMD